jgi:hypothetical protein
VNESLAVLSTVLDPVRISTEIVAHVLLRSEVMLPVGALVTPALVLPYERNGLPLASWFCLVTEAGYVCVVERL